MTESKKIKVNLGTFNLIKGIGMLCIIFFHMQERYGPDKLPALGPLFLVLRITGAGILPMFFMISGFNFKDKPAKVMLQKTWSELIIPYLWGAAGCIVLFPVLHIFFIGFLRSAYCTVLTIAAFALGLPREKVFFGRPTFSTQALWFLLAMFISMNILSYIVKKQKISTQILLTLLSVAVGYLLLRLDFIYYCIPQGMMAVGFCYVGYFIKQHKLLDRMISSPWTWVVLIPVFILQTLYGRFDMASGDYNLLDYLAAGCCSLLFMLLGIYSSRCTWKCLNWIKKVGIYSYWIICIHSVEMLVCPWFVLVEAFPDKLLLAFVIEVTLKVIIMSTGCTILKRISQNNYKKKRMIANGV